LPPPVPVHLHVLPDHDCPYLPGRIATSRAFMVSDAPGEVYHEFMDAGFRRSGRMIYQPICRGCRACLQIRVPVATFTLSKSQRRCWRRNSDLIVTIGEPVPTEEKHALYVRYSREWHGKGDADDYESFVMFLYDSPVPTVEFCYRDGVGRLLAVGICDLSPRSLSSVYLYHEPAESRRGVGIYSALYEIEHARAHAIPFYYLGYWVAGCATMDYKASFGPHEFLHPDGVWRQASY
jgi:arginyl-tRNA--protein-N-Asp/Glu arginylyltransferase